MDLAGAPRLTCFPQTLSRLPSNTDNSRRNRATIIFSRDDGSARAGHADSLVLLRPAPGPAPQQRQGHADLSRFSLDSAT